VADQVVADVGVAVLAWGVVDGDTVGVEGSAPWRMAKGPVPYATCQRPSSVKYTQVLLGSNGQGVGALELVSWVSMAIRSDSSPLRTPD
jgi:hypothetical protein